MPVCGFDQMWAAHPEWLDRYDFAIAKAPQASWCMRVVERSSEGEGEEGATDGPSRRASEASSSSVLSPTLSCSPSSPSLSSVSSASTSPALSPSSPSLSPSLASSASSTSLASASSYFRTGRYRHGCVRYKTAQPSAPLLATFLPGLFGSSEPASLYYTHFLWCDVDDGDHEYHPEFEAVHSSTGTGTDIDGDADTDTARETVNNGGEGRGTQGTGSGKDRGPAQARAPSLHSQRREHDGQGQGYRGYHCITRADLVGVFDHLVHNAEEAYHAHADLCAAMFEFERFQDHVGVSVGTEAEYGQLQRHMERQLERAVEIATPTSNATEYFGKYLAYLSDLERAQRLPSGFRPCSRSALSLISSSFDTPSAASASDSESESEAETGTDSSSSETDSRYAPPSHSGPHCLGAWRPAPESQDLDIICGTIDTFAFTAAEHWVRNGRKTLCAATDAAIAGCRAAVDALVKDVYGFMGRDVPPAWDRSKRRTDVVELWEQSRAHQASMQF